MMILNGAKERTQGDWEVLLGDAGLRIVKTWKVGHSVEGLIGCELA
jgi:hypothetical protein